MKRVSESRTFEKASSGESLGKRTGKIRTHFGDSPQALKVDRKAVHGGTVWFESGLSAKRSFIFLHLPFFPAEVDDEAVLVVAPEVIFTPIVEDVVAVKSHVPERELFVKKRRKETQLLCRFAASNGWWPRCFPVFVVFIIPAVLSER